MIPRHQLRYYFSFFFLGVPPRPPASLRSKFYVHRVDPERSETGGLGGTPRKRGERGAVRVRPDGLVTAFLSCFFKSGFVRRYMMSLTPGCRALGERGMSVITCSLQDDNNGAKPAKTRHRQQQFSPTSLVFVSITAFFSVLAPTS